MYGETLTTKYGKRTPYDLPYVRVGQPYHQRFGHTLRAGDPWHLLLDRTRRTYCGLRLRGAWVETVRPPGLCAECTRVAG